MSDNAKEVKEIYKTEYVDKELPTISFVKQIMTGTCDGSYESICVSDVTSEKAFNTFKKIKDGFKK